MKKKFFSVKAITRVKMEKSIRSYSLRFYEIYFFIFFLVFIGSIKFKIRKIQFQHTVFCSIMTFMGLLQLQIVLLSNNLLQVVLNTLSYSFWINSSRKFVCRFSIFVFRFNIISVLFCWSLTFNLIIYLKTLDIFLVYNFIIRLHHFVVWMFIIYSLFFSQCIIMIL